MILTARGVTRILRNEFQEAKSDLEESLQQTPGVPEATAAYAVASALTAGLAPWPAANKPNEILQAEELWKYVILCSMYGFDLPFRKFISEHPTHPLAIDVAKKSDLFDEAAANFVVPSLAVATA